jgi:uncharacterized delta-60 repeat protein
VEINSPLNIGELEDMTLQNDGKIIFVGYRGLADFDAVVGRLLPDGVEDSSFAGGFQAIGFGSFIEAFNSVALDLNQRVVAAGDSSGDVIVSRLKTDGSLDDTFSGNGRLTIDPDFLALADTDLSMLDLAVQRNAKPLLLVSTSSSFPNDLLVRLTSDGLLDTTFFGTGKVLLPIGVDAIAIDSRGRIIVGGRNSIARLLP